MPITFRVAELLARHPEGISQAELARRAGLSNTAVNDIVNNKTTRVTLSTLEGLCEALDVPPCDLIVYVPRAGGRSKPAKSARPARA